MLTEQRAKILVVEDDRSRRLLYRKHLESANYWVFEANRLKNSDKIWQDDNQEVESALSQLQSHCFHTAVIDLSLNADDNPDDKTGFDVLTAINKYQEGTKCILLTAYGQTADVRQALKVLGAHDYLDKSNYSQEKLLIWAKDATREASLRINAMLNTRLTYYELIEEPIRSAIKEKLKLTGEQEIRTVFEEALRPYFPYDSLYRQTIFDSIPVGEAHHQVLITRLWSRYLGSGIKLFIGSREACKFQFAVMEASGKKNGINYKEYEYSPNDKLVGLVEYLPYKSIGDFAIDYPIPNGIE